MFIFLSLALVKRYSELLELGVDENKNIEGRGYQKADLETLMSMGGASGYIAVLVLALYINSDDIRELYRVPQVMWLLCPVILFWISRIWIAARRGEVHDDPIIHAIRDKASWVVAGAAAAVIVLAT